VVFAEYEIAFMKWCTKLRGFLDLHNHRHFQRGTAAGAFLTGGHAGELPSQVDFGGYRVSADGAEGLSLRVIGNGCSHFSLFNLSDANSCAQVGENIVKVF
jgi:hypothetical protein